MDRPASVSVRETDWEHVVRRLGAVLVDLSLAAFTALAVLIVWAVLIALTIWAGAPVDPGIEEWNYLAIVELLLYYVPLKYV